MKLTSLSGLQELSYSGSQSEKQFPTTSVVSYTTMSPVQNELYKRCLIGLDFYESEQLYIMNSAKKQKIAYRHKRVQDALNIWKQEITNKKVNGFLGKLFPKSEIIQSISLDNSTSSKFINTLTFKELGISKNDIVEKLISLKFLPYNFSTL